jgi:hypothetical protein
MQNLAALMSIMHQRQMAPLQLQQAQQQVQAGQLENQQRQLQMQDMMTLRKLSPQYVTKDDQGNVTGYDWDGFYKAAAGSGVNPNTLATVQKTVNEAQLARVNLSKAQLDQENEINKGAFERLEGLRGIQDPNQRQAAYMQALQWAKFKGAQVGNFPTVLPPGDEGINQMEAMLGMHAQQLADAKTAAETKEAGARAGESEQVGNQKAVENAANEFSNAKNQLQWDKLRNYYQRQLSPAAFSLIPGQYSPENAQAMRNLGITPEKQASLPDVQQYIQNYLKANNLPDTPANRLQAHSDFINKTKVQPQITIQAAQNAGVTGTPGQPSAIAQAIAKGDMKWQDVVSNRTPMNVKEALLKEIKGINPAYNSGDFDVEKKVREAFTSGNYSQQLNSINRAREHMQTFLQAAADLDGGSVKAFNAIGNAFSVQFGSDKVGNLQIAKQAFSSEVGKAFAGSSVALADREELNKAIDNASSFTQLAGAARTADTLLAGAQKALQQTYDAGRQGQPNFGQNNQNQQLIYARDPQGQLHSAPAGTPLPQGWKQEQR